jgi:hypothetical protein
MFDLSCGGRNGDGVGNVYCIMSGLHSVLKFE